MERKSLSKKWKIIICSIALILAMAGTGVTVWAIARNYYRYNADFEVNITGGRYVNASVKGQSFLAGSSEALESHTATFNADTPDQDVDMSFNEKITMENDERVSKLRFEVTNNSPYSNHSDLILKPSNTVTDKDDVIITWYYSTNNTNFYVHTGEYLVAHKNDTLYLELRMLATENLYGTVNFTDSITIDLYSEMEEPADFEWEYEYNYDESTSTATKAKVCPTCSHKETAVEMEENEYLFYNDLENPTINITEKIENKVVFCSSNGPDYTLTFSGGLENVVFADSPLGTLNLEINGDNTNYTKYNNINIQRISTSINFNITYGDGHSISNQVSAVSNLKIFNCFSNSSSFIYSETQINNLILANCTIGPGTTISNVHNAIIKNIQVDYQNQIGISNATGSIFLYNNSATWLNISNINNANIHIINNRFEIEGVDSNTDWITLGSISNSAMSFVNNTASSQTFKTYKINTNDTISSSFVLPLV